MALQHRKRSTLRFKKHKRIFYVQILNRLINKASYAINFFSYLQDPANVFHIVDMLVDVQVTPSRLANEELINKHMKINQDMG